MSSTPTVFEDLTRAVVPVAIVGVAILGLVYWGVPPKAAEAPPPVLAAVQVIATPIEPFVDPIEVMVDGVAQPHRHISLAAEVGGRIKHKNPKCDDGKYISTGELLYQIDSADYESAVKRIDEELRQAENALKEWEVDRNNTLEQIKLSEQEVVFAENETKRQRSLRPNNAASEADVEQALRTEIAARLSLQNLKNQVRALDARKARAESLRDLQSISLAVAKRDLDRTKIVAPVDCLVVTDDCEEGSYVQAGKVVAIINDVNHAEVGCQLELEDLYWIWEMRSPEEFAARSAAPGAVYDVPPIPVTIEFPFHDRICKWAGVISRFGGTGIDLSTRTIPCRVHVENPIHSQVFTADGEPDQSIVPPPLATGMFVTVRIPVKPRVPLLEIPATAARSGGVVWLVQDGKLGIKNIKIARRMKDRVLVHNEPDGVQPGDRVIVSPLAVAEAGMALEEQVSE